MTITQVHRDFTLETLNWENQHSLSVSCSLVVLFIHRIKSYMTNLGLHLRHNHHPTLFFTQEQPYNQFDLHLHDHYTPLI
jgi:hypothetical protein